VGIEPTRDGITAPHTVLKTGRATRPHAPPYEMIVTTKTRRTQRVEHGYLKPLAKSRLNRRRLKVFVTVLAFSIVG